MARATTPLFVDPKDVILRMQLDETLDGIQAVVESGIVAAQLKVERIIDGRLARQSHDVRYFIDSQAFSGITLGGLYRLEIPSGMVRQDVAPVVTFSNDKKPFSTHSTIDSDLVQFDYERGYLMVDAATYGDNYIRIQADTGYEDGTRALPVEGLDEWSDQQQYAVGDQVAYQEVAYVCIETPAVGIVPTDATFWTTALVPQDPIPDAIYEAIMSLTPMVFNAQQTTNRNREAKEQYQTLTDHANMLLQPYVRTKGFTFRAL